MTTPFGPATATPRDPANYARSINQPAQWNVFERENVENALGPVGNYTGKGPSGKITLPTIYDAFHRKTIPGYNFALLNNVVLNRDYDAVLGYLTRVRHTDQHNFKIRSTHVKHNIIPYARISPDTMAPFMTKEFFIEETTSLHYGLASVEHLSVAVGPDSQRVRAENANAMMVSYKQTVMAATYADTIRAAIKEDLRVSRATNKNYSPFETCLESAHFLAGAKGVDVFMAAVMNAKERVIGRQQHVPQNFVVMVGPAALQNLRGMLNLSNAVNVKAFIEHIRDDGSAMVQQPFVRPESILAGLSPDVLLHGQATLSFCGAAMDYFRDSAVVSQIYHDPPVGPNASCDVNIPNPQIALYDFIEDRHKPMSHAAAVATSGVFSIGTDGGYSTDFIDFCAKNKNPPSYTRDTGKKGEITQYIESGQLIFEQHPHETHVLSQWIPPKRDGSGGSYDVVHRVGQIEYENLGPKFHEILGESVKNALEKRGIKHGSLLMSLYRQAVGTSDTTEMNIDDIFNATRTNFNRLKNGGSFQAPAGLPGAAGAAATERIYDVIPDNSPISGAALKEGMVSLVRRLSRMFPGNPHFSDSANITDNVIASLFGGSRPRIMVKINTDLDAPGEGPSPFDANGKWVPLASTASKATVDRIYSATDAVQGDTRVIAVEDKPLSGRPSLNKPEWNYESITASRLPPTPQAVLDEAQGAKDNVLDGNRVIQRLKQIEAIPDDFVAWLAAIYMVQPVTHAAIKALLSECVQLPFAIAYIRPAIRLNSSLGVLVEPDYATNHITYFHTRGWIEADKGLITFQFEYHRAFEVKPHPPITVIRNLFPKGHASGGTTTLVDMTDPAFGQRWIEAMGNPRVRATTPSVFATFHPLSEPIQASRIFAANVGGISSAMWLTRKGAVISEYTKRVEEKINRIKDDIEEMNSEIRTAPITTGHLRRGPYYRISTKEAIDGDVDGRLGEFVLQQRGCKKAYSGVGNFPDKIATVSI